MGESFQASPESVIQLLNKGYLNLNYGFLPEMSGENKADMASNVRAAEDSAIVKNFKTVVEVDDSDFNKHYEDITKSSTTITDNNGAINPVDLKPLYFRVIYPQGESKEEAGVYSCLSESVVTKVALSSFNKIKKILIGGGANPSKLFKQDKMKGTPPTSNNKNFKQYCLNIAYITNYLSLRRDFKWNNNMELANSFIEHIVIQTKRFIGLDSKEKVSRNVNFKESEKSVELNTFREYCKEIIILINRTDHTRDYLLRLDELRRTQRKKGIGRVPVNLKNHHKLSDLIAVLSKSERGCLERTYNKKKFSNIRIVYKVDRETNPAGFEVRREDSVELNELLKSVRLTYKLLDEFGGLKELMDTAACVTEIVNKIIARPALAIIYKRLGSKGKFLNAQKIGRKSSDKNKNIAFKWGECAKWLVDHTEIVSSQYQCRITLCFLLSSEIEVANNFFKFFAAHKDRFQKLENPKRWELPK